MPEIKNDVNKIDNKTEMNNALKKFGEINKENTTSLNNEMAAVNKGPLTAAYEGKDNMRTIANKVEAASNKTEAANARMSILRNKLIFVTDENIVKGGQDDQKGTYIPAADKEMLVRAIDQLQLVDENQINTLDPKALTVAVQDAAFDKINANSQKKNDFDKYLQQTAKNGQVLGMPNAKVLSDGLIGPRFAAMIKFLKQEEEKPKETSTVAIEKKPEPVSNTELLPDALRSGYVINVTGDTKTGAYYFPKDEATFNMVTKMFAKFQSKETGGTGVDRSGKPLYGQATYDMSNDTFLSYINNPSLGSDFAFNNGIKDKETLTQAKDNYLNALGNPYHRTADVKTFYTEKNPTATVVANPGEYTKTAKVEENPKS